MFWENGPYGPIWLNGQLISKLSLKDKTLVPFELHFVFSNQGAGKKTGSIRNNHEWVNALTGEQMPDDGVVHVAVFRSPYTSPFLLLPAFPHQKEELEAKVLSLVSSLENVGMNVTAKTLSEFLEQAGFHIRKGVRA